jgi:hypothetical protein
MGVIDYQTPTQINLEPNIDVDDDLLEVTVTTSPQYGTATGGTNIIAYTPDSNYCGNDNFTYEVSDGHGGTDSGTVDIVIVQTEMDTVFKQKENRYQQTTRI